MALPHILGIHHVTATCGEAQENLDFYTGVLGMRLVKLTVNFDDPSAYHLYYGDASGSPGSVLTFFPYPGGMAGQPGSGQATEVALAIPWGSIPYWESRLHRRGVSIGRTSERFDETVIPFRDPHGLRVELVAPQERQEPHQSDERWQQEGEDAVAPENAIEGVHSVTLTETDLEETEELLRGTMGFQPVTQAGYRHRFERNSNMAAPGWLGRFVDVLHTPSGQRGRVAIGTVHHVAFRTPNEADQPRWREVLSERGLHVSPVMNRDYFRSIYFREPGGILFEIATDGPGFGIDEPGEALGSALQLPEAYRSRRDQILAALPPLRLPGGTLVGA